MLLSNLLPNIYYFTTRWWSEEIAPIGRQRRRITNLITDTSTWVYTIYIKCHDNSQSIQDIMWCNRKKYIILTGASGRHYGSRILNGYRYLVENETCGRLRTITVRFPRTFSVPRCVGTTEKPLGTRYSVGVPRRCVSRPPRHRGRKRSNRLERHQPSVVLQFSL